MSLKNLLLCCLPAMILLACGDPEPEMDYRVEGLHLMSEQQYEEALPNLLTHLESNPNDTAVWYNTGIAYHSMDSFGKAIECYSKTLEWLPANAGAQRNLAICYMALEQPENAHPLFQQLVNSDSMDIPDYYYLAKCEMVAGDQDAAYDAVSKGFRANQENMNGEDYSSLFVTFMQENFTEDYLESMYYKERNMAVIYAYNNDSIRHGKWAAYDSEGLLFQSGTYKNGKKDGLETEWFPNGNKHFETPYKEGALHGVRRSWYPDGALNSEVTYKNDLREGWALIWHENGRGEAAVFFENGIRDSVAVRYFLDGKLMEEFRYKDDVEHGRAIVWNPDVENYMEVSFDKGIPVDEKELTELPEDITPFPWK